MASVNLSPIGNGFQFFNSNGTVLNAGLINTYQAGSSTQQPTFTTSVGNVQNANPIQLGPDGRPPQEIWLTTGVAYKFVLTDSLANIIGTYDNLLGINDVTFSASEWTSGPTPTYISGTSFSLVGDQTATFTINRRLKFTVTAGTVYGRILTSAFTTLTTVTMQMDDSFVLDSGLSAVSYGFLSSTNISIPSRIGTTSGTDTYTVNVGLPAKNVGDEFKLKIANPSTSSAPTINFDGLGAITVVRSNGNSLVAGDLNGEHTFRYNGTNLIVLNPINPPATQAPVGSVVYIYKQFT